MRFAAWALLALVLAPGVAEAQVTYVAHDHVRYRPIEIGVSAIGGVEAHTRQSPVPVDGMLSFGADLLGSIVPGFAIGVTRLGVGFGYSSIDGPLFDIGGTPTIELSFFVGAHTQLLMQLGAALGISTATASHPIGFNAAATGILGARWWLGNLISLALLVGVDVGLTNPGLRFWFAGPLGQGEPAAFLGLQLGFHL
jgi:hypothetical protein